MPCYTPQVPRIRQEYVVTCIDLSIWSCPVGFRVLAKQAGGAFLRGRGRAGQASLGRAASSRFSCLGMEE